MFACTLACIATWRHAAHRHPSRVTARRPACCSLSAGRRPFSQGKRGPRMGRHGKGPHTPQQQRRTVDTTGTAHLVAVGAAAGEPPRGRYPAICGEDALVARQARHCRLCAPIPAQGRGVHEIPAGRRLSSNLFPPPLAPGGRPDTTAPVTLRGSSDQRHH